MFIYPVIIFLYIMSFNETNDNNETNTNNEEVTIEEVNESPIPQVQNDNATPFNFAGRVGTETTTSSSFFGASSAPGLFGNPAPNAPGIFGMAFGDIRPATTGPFGFQPTNRVAFGFQPATTQPTGMVFGNCCGGPPLLCTCV
jgi:hypothetical protein